MTHEHLQDEKVSIQKELLHLESTFGQTVARNEELFHPIYARYRAVKRFLARSTASVSEIFTVLFYRNISLFLTCFVLLYS